MVSPGPGWPASMTFFAASPSGVPAFTAARSMSPVEICGMPNFSRMKAACVPLPAPGGPKRIRRIKAGSISCQHFTDGLEILRRIDPWRDVRFADRDRDAVSVPQHAQLLQRLGALERRGRQRRVALEET